LLDIVRTAIDCTANVRQATEKEKSCCQFTQSAASTPIHRRERRANRAFLERFLLKQGAQSEATVAQQAKHAAKAHGQAA